MERSYTSPEVTTLVVYVEQGFALSEEEIPDSGVVIG